MKTIKYILLLFFIIAVNAQEMSTISGFVRDDATGEPISYANVFLSEPSIGSATNVDGNLSSPMCRPAAINFSPL